MEAMDFDSAKVLDQNDFETLYSIYVDFIGSEVSVLVNENGEEYYPTDFQGLQPTTLEECADYEWVLGEYIDF